MSQHDVYQFLKANKGKMFTTKEIANHLEGNMSSTTTNCKKLREANDIAYERKKDGSGRYIYYYYIPIDGKKINNHKKESAYYTWLND